jgi:hypothetical protein
MQQLILKSQLKLEGFKVFEGFSVWTMMLMMTHLVMVSFGVGQIIVNIFFKTLHYITWFTMQTISIFVLYPIDRNWQLCVSHFFYFVCGNLNSRNIVFLLIWYFSSLSHYVNPIKLKIHLNFRKNDIYMYSRSRLMWSLWARPKVITLTEW